MKKILSVLLCAVLCACTLSTAAPAFAKAVADAEKTMLIVELEGENALEMLGEGMTLQSALRPIDAERKNAVQAIESVSRKAEVTYTYTHVLNGVAVEAARADAAKIERLDGVRAVYDVGGVKVRAESVPAGSLISSGSMIGVDKLHEAGIDGTGTAIAVIDGGLEWDHTAMLLSDPASAKISKDDVAAVLAANTMNCKDAKADSLYKSAKVPFAYDYCDKDTEVEDWNNADPDHGTHVSGIAAGNSDKLVGVAPEAQVLMFKIDVYNDETFLANLLAAIDDAAKFDVASMNMSVGMDFEMRSDPAHALLVKAIENARNSGITVCTAAGNAGVFSDSVLQPDNGTNGVPNSIADSTSVASVDNVNLSQPVAYMIDALRFGDKQIPVLGFTSLGFPSGCEFVPVGKKGPESPVAGKVVLLYDSSVNARPYLHDSSIKAYIFSEAVMNTNMNEIYQVTKEMMVIDNTDAYRLMHCSERTYELVYSEYYAEPADVLRASEFTGFGVSEDLELTVDIAAPGGIIFSSVIGGQYDVYNGTSMASPHIAGSAALLEQVMNKTNPDLTGREKADLKESLMCSTADPVISGDAPLSPRAVGAGLVNLAEAVGANAVLVGENDRTAINVGDGIEDTLKLSFTVRNFSKKDVRYDTLSFDVITDDYTRERVFDETTGTYSTRQLITGQSVPLTFSVAQSDMPRSISLHPGESRTVTCTLQLDAQQLAENAEVFTNGFYVEGYVYLTDSMSGNTPLNIPFMGFRGNWSTVPALEYGDIYDEFWGMLSYVGEGYSVRRSIKRLTFTLVDKDGVVCGTHTEEYVKKGTVYEKTTLADLFDGETVPDGNYKLIVRVQTSVPGGEEQICDDGITVRIDRTPPTVLDVKRIRTADGCDVVITCDCDDLDYVELHGASLLDYKFYDLYPFVVTAVDRSGLESVFGKQSLALRICEFLVNIPVNIILWMMRVLGLVYEE